LRDRFESMTDRINRSVDNGRGSPWQIVDIH